MEAKKHLHIPSINIPLWWPSGRGWRRLARWLLPSPGNVLFTLLVVGGLLWATSAGALPFRAPALAGDSTTTISYQGRLAYDNGDPVNSAGIGMQFCLYDTDVGGSPVDDWCETHLAVPVEDGLFHVRLGSVLPIPVSTLASHSNLWLGITVGSDDSEMEPREQIASVPYAMIASTVADGAITTEKITDGAVNSAKIASGVVDLGFKGTERRGMRIEVFESETLAVSGEEGATSGDVTWTFSQPFTVPPLVVATNRELCYCRYVNWDVVSVSTTETHFIGVRSVSQGTGGYETRCKLHAVAIGY